MNHIVLRHNTLAIYIAVCHSTFTVNGACIVSPVIGKDCSKPCMDGIGRTVKSRKLWLVMGNVLHWKHEYSTKLTKLTWHPPANGTTRHGKQLCEVRVISAQEDKRGSWKASSTCNTTNRQDVVNCLWKWPGCHLSLCLHTAPDHPCNWVIELPA